jgi:hypothetical protein
MDEQPICGAHLYIADDHGDNEGTLVCRLLPDHAGRHLCEFRRKSKDQVNHVQITFDHDERPPKLNKWQIAYSRGVIEKYNQLVDYDLKNIKHRRLFVRFSRAMNRLEEDHKCWHVDNRPVQI